MILVMGATGNVGSKITTNLLAQGRQVRCVARHFPNREAFKGADFAQGDANNVAFLTDAMRGCSSVFVMIPPNVAAEEMRFFQNKFGEVIAEAIEEAGIKKVVNLSSVGADLEKGTGPILGLHDQEERLNEITHADIVHLRPTSFMENLLNGIPSIIALNCYFGTVPADALVSMIATRDIATKATALLANPTFKGHNIEYLLGERDLTYREVIRVLGSAINKPALEYVEVPENEMKNYYIGAGISEDWAEGYLEMANALVDGSIGRTVIRSKENTTSTSIEEFARTTFLNAYKKALTEEEQKKQGPPKEPFAERHP